MEGGNRRAVPSQPQGPAKPSRMTPKPGMMNPGPHVGPRKVKHPHLAEPRPAKPKSRNGENYLQLGDKRLRQHKLVRKIGNEPKTQKEQGKKKILKGKFAYFFKGRNPQDISDRGEEQRGPACPAGGGRRLPTAARRAPPAGSELNAQDADTVTRDRAPSCPCRKRLLEGSVCSNVCDSKTRKANLVHPQGEAP